MQTTRAGWFHRAVLSRKSTASYFLLGVLLAVLAGRWLTRVSAQLEPSPLVTTIVAGGDATPLGGVFASDGTPALGLASGPAGAGSTAFFALVNADSTQKSSFGAQEGIFRTDGNTVSKIAAVGDLTPLGGTFAFFSQPTQNQRGDVAFSAAIEGGTASQAVFLVSGGRLTEVAATKEATPLGELSPLSSPPALNNLGEVVFGALLTGATAGPGIFRASAGSVSKVVVDGDVTAFGERVSFAGPDPFPPAVNDAGDVVFTTPQGIFLSSRAGTIAKIAAIGDAALLGTTFRSFTPPTLNNPGDIAFGASVTDSTGEVSNAIFLISQRQLIRIVADGAPAPGGGVLALHPGMFPPPSLNDKGEIAFEANITGAGVVRGEFPASAVFLFAGGQLRKLVGQGDPTPLGGTILGDVVSFTLSNASTLSFMGIVDTDGDGNPNNQVIFSTQVPGLSQ